MAQLYTVDSIPISQNGQAVEANCMDVMFINYGTNTLIINNSLRIPPPVVAGQFNFLVISGNANEIDVTKYICRFSGAGTNDALIVRRNKKG